MAFAYRALTFYGRTFQSGSANQQFCNSSTAPTYRQMVPTTPAWQRRRAITPGQVWAVPVSLTTTQGIAVAFSSSGY